MEDNNRNLILAMVLSAIVMLVWSIFFAPEPPPPAPEAQQTTSPAFPPVPDNGTSPMQGIETPETADNLPQGIEQ